MNSEVLDNNFVLVDINIGNIDQNLDLGHKYGLNLAKGVPALVVLDSHGRLIYSQKQSEFENMHSVQSSTVNDFLERWK